MVACVLGLLHVHDVSQRPQLGPRLAVAVHLGAIAGVGRTESVHRIPTVIAVHFSWPEDFWKGMKN